MVPLSKWDLLSIVDSISSFVRDVEKCTCSVHCYCYIPLLSVEGYQAFRKGFQSAVCLKTQPIPTKLAYFELNLLKLKKTIRDDGQLVTYLSTKVILFHYTRLSRGAYLMERLCPISFDAILTVVTDTSRWFPPAGQCVS